MAEPNVIEVECPSCGAEPGETCFPEVADINLFHHLRWNASADLRDPSITPADDEEPS